MGYKQNIKTFSELYEKTVSGDYLLSSFMTGHLAIEFLLVRIIELSQPKLINFAEGLNHYKLIELVFGLNHIDEKQKEVLLLINKMRNKFAHHLTYEPTIIELEEILSKASKAFNDTTDGIEQGLGEIKGKNQFVNVMSGLFLKCLSKFLMTCMIYIKILEGASKTFKLILVQENTIREPVAKNCFKLLLGLLLPLCPHTVYSCIFNSIFLSNSYICLLSVRISNSWQAFEG